MWLIFGRTCNKISKRVDARARRPIIIRLDTDYYLLRTLGTRMIKRCRQKMAIKTGRITSMMNENVTALSKRRDAWLTRINID